MCTFVHSMAFCALSNYAHTKESIHFDLVQSGSYSGINLYMLTTNTSDSVCTTLTSFCVLTHARMNLYVCILTPFCVRTHARMIVCVCSLTPFRVRTHARNSARTIVTQNSVKSQAPRSTTARCRTAKWKAASASRSVADYIRNCLIESVSRSHGTPTPRYLLVILVSVPNSMNVDPL